MEPRANIPAHLSNVDVSVWIWWCAIALDFWNWTHGHLAHTHTHTHTHTQFTRSFSHRWLQHRLFVNLIDKLDWSGRFPLISGENLRDLTHATSARLKQDVCLHFISENACECCVLDSFVTCEPHLSDEILLVSAPMTVPDLKERLPRHDLCC